MARIVGSIIAGWVVFLFLGWLSSTLVLQLWPAYAAAYPERAFTLPMHVTRLAVGASLVLFTGWFVSALSPQSRQAVLWCAIIPLVETVWAHLHEPIWSHYPPWYHFVTFMIPVPCAQLGAWLQRSQARLRLHRAG